MVEKQSALESKARSWLIERGVEIDDIAELVLFLQQKYHPGLELDICRQNVEHVLRKREVQNAVLTGIQLDVMAEKGELVQPLQNIISADEGLYG
ncbi:phosphatidylglycerophosphatase A, partial [Listeria seeligeri]|nr:phosphatidylglycerophosphatase A [Listeria seeligeri]